MGKVISGEQIMQFPVVAHGRYMVLHHGDEEDPIDISLMNFSARHLLVTITEYVYVEDSLEETGDEAC